MGTTKSLATFVGILGTTSSHLVSLLVVVPLEVVEDGRAHQQVGEGDDDKGQGADLPDMGLLVKTNQAAEIMTNCSNQDSFVSSHFFYFD